MNARIELIEPADVDDIQLAPKGEQPVVAMRPDSPMQIVQPRNATPADLLRMAMERGDGDLDRLERLMKMQQEWRAEEARIAFREGFAAFKAENIVVPKTKQVTQRAKGGGPGPTYRQTEFHVVANLLQPALSRHGFGYRFDVTFGASPLDPSAPWCTVTCKLEHRDGHVETLTLGGPPDDSGAKNPLQEMQSTSTFLMRHALLSITGTAQAGADNDGRGARGYQEDDAGGPSAETLSLLTRGEAESKNGTKALLAWWQELTAGQREPLMADFGRLRADAAKHDQKGGAK